MGRQGAAHDSSFARLIDGDVSDVVDVSYVVKSDLESGEQLAEVLRASVRGECQVINSTGDAVVLTKGQADVLRMIAAGLSNEKIAEERGSSERAVNQMINRLFTALNVASVPGHNPRVAAVQMLNRARIGVDE